MKKVIVVIIVFIFVIGYFGFQKESYTWEVTEDSKAFKIEYEKDNNEVYASGREYIKLDIPEENPFVYIDYNQTIDIIENGSGLLFFSRPGCPYCRSTMMATIAFARQNEIKKIYYYNPEEIRSAYSEEYIYLLDLLGEYLPVDYVTQSEEDENFNLNLKRLVVPHLFFISNGQVIAHHQEGRQEFAIKLTKEQEQEIINIYNSAYQKYQAASGTCSLTNPEDC